ncbi:MAG: aminotransferase class III-fold pyridoxal phosphate-dependent enzyme, partial [Betaproteobacteria bacterium]
KVPGFPKVPLNDLAAVEQAITDKTVAVMLEPIQGEAGVIPATASFLTGLLELTRKHGILLILDEIQTGMGRTGRLFAHEHFGVEPDIMTLGKGIGGGVPLAALVAKEEVCCFEPGDQGGTFNGNPLATAAGCAVMETLLQPGFMAQVAVRGDALRAALEQVSTKHGLGEVRGKGLLLALDLKQEIGAAIVDAAFHRGLLLNAPRPNSLRFMPALTVGQEEIAQMATILDEILEEILPG